MKPETLKFNFEFSRVYRYGKCAGGKILSVHMMRRYPGVKQSGYTVDPRVIRPGFCANKRVLGAVGRNRVRRLLREAFRSYEDKLPGGIDIVLTYKGGKDIPSLGEFKEELGKALGRLSNKG